MKTNKRSGGGGKAPESESGRSDPQRSALTSDALRRRPKHLLGLEEQDRRGYLTKPPREKEFRVWEDVAVWPEL